LVAGPWAESRRIVGAWPVAVGFAGRYHATR
jgi:hypothetical protein